MISKNLQILSLQPRISKVFYPSLEQFFLTVGQNNFGNKIPFLFSYLGNTYPTNSADADLYVFLTEYSDQFGYAGLAYVGTLCGDKRSRVSIVAYFDDDIYAAEVKSVSGLIYIMTIFIYW